MPKTQMAHAVHWCPFCEEKPYKSKGNLSNHMEQNHEPQTLRICLECCGNWNTDLGRSRHVRRVGCSGRQFESARHEMRKGLYGCGRCARLFDDFGIRQDHLFNHQQSGVPKAAWSMDNVMRALLSHHSISGAWTDSCQTGSIQLDHLEDLHWDWTKATAVEVLTALEHKRLTTTKSSGQYWIKQDQV